MVDTFFVICFTHPFFHPFPTPEQVLRRTVLETSRLFCDRQKTAENRSEGYVPVHVRITGLRILVNSTCHMFTKKEVVMFSKALERHASDVVAGTSHAYDFVGHAACSVGSCPPS